MSWISVICFFLCAFLAGTALLKKADVFAPSRIFGFVWFFAIGLADLKFSAYQHEWSLYSWLVLFAGVGSMMLGFFIVAAFFLHRPMLSISSVRQSISSKQINKKMLFNSIIVLSLLFLIAIAVEAFLEGGLPAFSHRPDRARVNFGVFGFHLLVLLMPSILFLETEYYLFFWKDSSTFHKTILVLCFITIFVLFSLLLQRFPLVMWAIPSLSFAYYATNRIKGKHLLLLSAVFLGFLQLIRTIRAVGYIENYIYTISRMRFPKEYAIFSEPYMYIVMNLENFTRSVDLWTSYSFGYFTFDFIMALTGLKHPLVDEFGLVERPFLTSNFNTYSFLMPYYQDFGVFGVIAIPLLLGITIGFIYHSLRRNPTIGNMMLYSFSCYVMIISFFFHTLGALFMFANMLVLIVLHYFLLPIRSNKNN